MSKVSIPPVSPHNSDRSNTMKKVLTMALVALAALSLAGSASASTAGQRNALSKARSYLQFSAFSKKGLAEQLEYEGFSRSNARWAVARVGVSWNGQAVKKARSYLHISAFSRSGLIGQLEYDGFTHSQAVYGVNRAYH
jgi:hypothetical protein